MINQKPQVEVLVNGKPVKVHSHEGRLFIEAKEGSEYTIKVRNNSWNRVLAVASVDGLNVINGEIATKGDSAGYVLSGGSAYDIKGFRVSNDTVNAFAFGKKEKSYAAKSEATDGSTQDCGVIGVIFYAEKTKPIVYRKRLDEDDSLPTPRPPAFPPREPWRPTRPEPLWTCKLDDGISKLSAIMSDSCVTRSMAMPKGEFDMGTVFTEKEVEDRVSETEFKTGRVLETVEIYYASREQLEAMGVPLTKEPKVAFPSAFKPAGFCKPPKRD